MHTVAGNIVAVNEMGTFRLFSEQSTVEKEIIGRKGVKYESEKRDLRVIFLRCFSQEIDLEKS